MGRVRRSGTRSGRGKSSREWGVAPTSRLSIGFGCVGGAAHDLVEGDAEFPQLAPKRLAVDPEALARLPLVPARVPKDAGQQFALDRYEHARVQAVFAGSEQLLDVAREVDSGRLFAFVGDRPLRGGAQ